MNITNIMPSEKSQTPKGTYCVIHLNEMIRTGESIEIESRLVVVRLGEGGWKLLMDMRFLFEVMKMFQNYIVVMVAQPCEYTKNPLNYTL